MPTIRTPSWRPRELHGHKVEALKTRDKNALFADRLWHEAPLVESTRALLVQRDLTAWFIRRPGETRTIATLVEFDGFHTPAERPFREATFDRDIPLTTGREPIMIGTGRRNISVVEDRVVLYLNKSPEFLWIDVAHWLEAQTRMTPRPEDHDAGDLDAFKDV